MQKKLVIGPMKAQRKPINILTANVCAIQTTILYKTKKSSKKDIWNSKSSSKYIACKSSDNNKTLLFFRNKSNI